jgi:hypothetical protein
MQGHESSSIDRTSIGKTPREPGSSFKKFGMVSRWVRDEKIKIRQDSVAVGAQAGGGRHSQDPKVRATCIWGAIAGVASLGILHQYGVFLPQIIRLASFSKSSRSIHKLGPFEQHRSRELEGWRQILLTLPRVFLLLRKRRWKQTGS